MKQSATLWSSGRREEAVKLLRPLAEQSNDHPVLDCFAHMLQQQGSIVEAYQYRRRANQAKPDDANGLCKEAECLILLDRPSEAIDLLDEAIRLQPATEWFHHTLGIAWMKLGDSAAARLCFERSLELRKTRPALMALANLCYEEGRTLEGNDYLHRAFDPIQDEAERCYSLAAGLADSDQTDLAESFLQESLAIDPNRPEAILLAAKLAQRRGDFARAEAKLLRVKELRPVWTQTYMMIAAGRRFSPEDDELIYEMRVLLDNPHLGSRQKMWLLFAMGKVHDDLSDYETAMEHYDSARRISLQKREETGPLFDRAALTREFDLLIETFDADYLERHKSFGSPSLTPVFIVGMIRSGTTLTEQILSRHPAIAAAAELKFWPTYRARLGRAIKEDRRPDEIQGVADEYLAYLKRTAPTSPRITDKMPGNFRLLGLIHTTFPRAKIVHCRRHPVDTCISIYTTPGVPGGFADRKESIADMVRQYLKLMDHWRRVLPADSFLEVDYEETIEDKESVARRIIEFLGLSWDDAVLDHETNQRMVQTPSLWQVRQPLYSSSVGRRHNYEPWCEAFTRLLG